MKEDLKRQEQKALQHLEWDTKSLEQQAEKELASKFMDREADLLTSLKER